MLPTAGFIPPPVVPLVPTAVNGIVATGGLLAGVSAGAKAGAVLGPKGVLAGALVGGLLLPLLLPQTTAPDTLPEGLDPGLNGPAPEPGPAAPPIGLEPTVISGPANDPVGTEYEWEIRVALINKYPISRRCDDGTATNNGNNLSSWRTYSGKGSQLKVWSIPRELTRICGQSDDVSGREYGSIGGADLLRNGQWETLITEGSYEYGTVVSKSSYWAEPAQARYEQWSITRDVVPVDLPDGLNGTPGTVPEKPRPLPVPLEPLPTPAPQPAPVPLPEPGPEPEPMVVPSPDNPDAPPITIPQAPPAPPEEVPGPEPEPSPLTVPITPTPMAPPLPVPGVPTIPEPTPDPSVVPAPGPSPDPAPSPGPVPIPQPEPDPLPGVAPAPSPIPMPVPVPGSPPVVPPETPDEAIATTPGGSLSPVQLPLPIPTPPDAHFPVSGQPPVTPGGVQPNLKAIAKEVGRIEQKVAKLQNGEGFPDLTDWLWLLPLLQNFFEQPIPGTTYDLAGVCEGTEPGQPQPVAEFPVEEGLNLQAIINRIDALPDVLQQHLAYRTPTCRGPKNEGDFRTLSFISDEQSPNGKSRVAKRFRYRSSSGLGLPDIVDHWRSFVWQAGPVCVQHADAPWGTPQVWAATADEGKRVIRHAAGEAGIDPDQVGRWIVGGSSSPRLGMPGTMRINTSGGYYMITARDGSSERPLVVVVPPHP